MNNNQQNNNRGAIFYNNKKKTDKSPDYTGTCIIDGKEKFICAWNTTSKKGQNYISFSFSEPQQNNQFQQNNNQQYNQGQQQYNNQQQPQLNNPQFNQQQNNNYQSANTDFPPHEDPFANAQQKQGF